MHPHQSIDDQIYDDIDLVKKDLTAHELPMAGIATGAERTVRCRGFPAAAVSQMYEVVTSESGPQAAQFHVRLNVSY
jgi:hypothetical protein